jgi:hypothetical protein
MQQAAGIRLSEKGSFSRQLNKSKWIKDVQSEGAMDHFKLYAYGYLALHVLIDLILAVRLYYRIETPVVSIILMSACLVFALFLFFGIKNEQFRGRHDTVGYRWRDPVAYWIGFALYVIVHLIFTITMAL